MSEIAPRLLTRVQAAEFLNVSPNKFSDQVAAGYWPAPLRQGRWMRWDREALERRIAEHQGVVFNDEPTGEEQILRAMRDGRRRNKARPTLRHSEAKP